MHECYDKPMQRQGLFCYCMLLTVPCNSCFAHPLQLVQAETLSDMG